MTEYRRYRASAATWFFTVNLAERRNNRLLVDHIEILRAAFSKVKAEHPFRIDAIVVLPDHLHCVWTLPVGDADFSTRWSLIKAGFPAISKKVSGYPIAAPSGARGGYGNGGFGSIASAMTWIISGILTTSIGIR